MTDWSNPQEKVSKYFTVHELTYLPSWSCYHSPSAEEQANLTRLALKMDEVREIIGKPIKVHVTIRPTSVNCPGSPHNGGNYNRAIGSVALKSAHISGLAMDFDVPGQTCDDVRAILVPLLDHLGMRCEDGTGTNWVHLDLAPVINQRFFKV